MTDGVDPSGRMLFSGLSVLPAPDTPFGGLWHAADLVREHRGDGHIAAWIPHVDSTEITVMTELAWGIPPRSYVFTRGWTEDEVDAAYDRLHERGLIDGDALDRGRDRAARAHRAHDRPRQPGGRRAPGRPGRRALRTARTVALARSSRAAATPSIRRTSASRADPSRH